jgi:hypothetical protein
MRYKINVYKVLVRKSEGQRSHGKHRRRWEYNNQIALKEIAQEGVDWIFF